MQRLRRLVGPSAASVVSSRHGQTPCRRDVERNLRHFFRGMRVALHRRLHDENASGIERKGVVSPSGFGAEMTRRRMKLAAPHAGEITVNTVRAYPAVALALTGAVAVGALLAARAFMRPSGLGALVAA
jgi:hypothetical protein